MDLTHLYSVILPVVVAAADSNCHEERDSDNILEVRPHFEGWDCCKLIGFGGSAVVSIEDWVAAVVL